MYTHTNFPTKKALKEAVADPAIEVTCFQPGPFPGTTNGTGTIEGPHYPKPHRFYASVQIEGGVVVKVLS